MSEWNVCPHHKCKHIAAYLLKYPLEEVETLKLVDEKRILLLVSCILYRLLEVIHIAQVLFPVLINQYKCYRFCHSPVKFHTLALICLLEVDYKLHYLRSV